MKFWDHKILQKNLLKQAHEMIYFITLIVFYYIYLANVANKICKKNNKICKYWLSCHFSCFLLLFFFHINSLIINVNANSKKGIIRYDRPLYPKYVTALSVTTITQSQPGINTSKHHINKVQYRTKSVPKYRTCKLLITT